MTDEHTLMREFNKNFQVYKDIRFLKFNLEKSLGKPVHAIDVYLSRSVILRYRKHRYMVPIAVSINGQKRTSLEPILGVLGFIPLFDIICNEEVLLINLEDGMRSYNLVGANTFKEASVSLVKKFNVMFNDVDNDETKLVSVENELKRLNIPYDKVDGILEIQGQNIIITQLSTFVLPDKYLKDYIVISPEVRYLYRMRLINNQQDGRLTSLGFIVRSNNEDIVIHPEEHKCIVVDGKIIEP